MRKLLIMCVLAISLSIPTAAMGLSLSVLPVEAPYVPIRGVLVVGPEFMPMEQVPYTLLVDGMEYLIDVDNPNILPLIWGLKEGAYAVTALAYLVTEMGHYPDLSIECDVAHVSAFIFE